MNPVMLFEYIYMGLFIVIDNILIGYLMNYIPAFSLVISIFEFMLMKPCMSTFFFFFFFFFIL